MAERFHGTRTRGLRAVPTSPSFEGRFGRMFRRLPVFTVDPDRLRDLGDRMQEGTAPEPPPGDGEPMPSSWGGDPIAPDARVLDGDNDAIPAGYTYLGQFIDHDITLDPVSSLQRANDPDALVNFRTPKYDLDSLYGRGPADDPFMYDTASPTRMTLLTGPVFQDNGTPAGPAEGGEQIDLLRNPLQRAIIGDPRNDENTIVSQLHLGFLRFHNRVVEQVAARGLVEDDLFKEVQRIVRWHYQWVVVHDYLRRTIGDDLWTRLLTRNDDGAEEFKLRFYRPKKNAYMPLEFSVAAFRFGHSQVRGGYRINELVAVPTFVPEASPDRLADLRGFRGLPPRWQVSWPNLFNLDGSFQPSRLINTRLAIPLFGLPGEKETNKDARSLARRNLLRGQALELPAGEDVAEAIGAKPLTQEELRQNVSVDSTDLGFGGRTPLWFYVLAEAEARAGGNHLGPVGGRIVGETLLGLLRTDRLSYWSVKPNWTPAAELDPLTDQGEAFDMSGLLRLAVPDRVVRF